MNIEESEQGVAQERLRADITHFGAKLTDFVYRPTNKDASEIESQNRIAQMAFRMTDFLQETGSSPTWVVRFRVPEESEHPTTTTIQIIDYFSNGTFDELVVDTFTYTADDNEGIIVGPDGITDPTSLSYLRLIREGLLEVVDEVIANPNPGVETDLDPVIAGFSALRSAGKRDSKMQRIVGDVEGNLSYYRQMRERRYRQRQRGEALGTTSTKLEDPTGASLPVVSGESVKKEADQSLDTQIASQIALQSVLAGTPVQEDTIKHLDADYRGLLEQVEQRLRVSTQEYQENTRVRGIIDAILTGDDIAQGEIEELDEQTQQTIRKLRDKITTAEQAGTYRSPFETDREAVANLGLKDKSGSGETTLESVSQEVFDATKDILESNPVIIREKKRLTKELDDVSKRDIFAQLETQVGILSLVYPSLNPTAIFMYLDNIRREMGIVLLQRSISGLNAALATDLFKAALLATQGEDEKGQARALNLLDQLYKDPLK